MVFMNGITRDMKDSGNKVSNMVMDFLLMKKKKKEKVFGIKENVLLGLMNN